MRYFDYETIVREAHITPDDLTALCALIRREFPSDDMMYELHVLRACLAIRDGHLSVEQATAREAA